MTRPLALVVSLMLVLAVPPAEAKHGDEGGGGDVRVAGTCGKGATSKLRLKSEDGDIEVRFEVERFAADDPYVRAGLVASRRVERWNVVI